MKYYNYFFLYFLFISVTFLSCRKFVEIPPPVSMISDVAVFSDSVNISNALTAIYATQVGVGFGISASSSMGGFVDLQNSISADEFSIGSDLSRSGFEYYFRNDVPITDDDNWYSFYKIIYAANACIEGINKSNGISSSVRDQLMGEAKFIRALFYFHFVNLFGDVPLILSTDYKDNAIKPRNSKDSVYQQVVTDLEEAAGRLKGTYPTAGKARPNKYTAKALLAKVYLYLKQWGRAEDLASEIINSGSYQLEADLNQVFKKGSTETIWQLVPYLGRQTGFGNTFVPPDINTIPQFVMGDDLLNSFEGGDQRKMSWISKNTIDVNGTPVDFYFPYKYKVRGTGSGTTSEENYIVFRLAEIYLIRAEARLEQGKITGASSAEQDLNLIRNRAGLANTSANTQQAMRTALIQERRIELFIEGSNRWYDLKRWNVIDAVMTPAAISKGANWKPTARLYPIPLVELQTNPFLVQNPGY